MTNFNNMSIPIRMSVGAGKAPNHKQDIEVVQSLLNRHVHELTPKRMPLPITGMCGISMVEMIKDFQKQVVGFHRPDGRVDPTGKTLKYLNKPSSPFLTPQHGNSNKPIPLYPIASGSFSAFIESLELRHFSAVDLTKGFTVL